MYASSRFKTNHSVEEQPTLAATEKQTNRKKPLAMMRAFLHKWVANLFFSRDTKNASFEATEDDAFTFFTARSHTSSSVGSEYSSDSEASEIETITRVPLDWHLSKGLVQSDRICDWARWHRWFFTLKEEFICLKPGRVAQLRTCCGEIVDIVPCQMLNVTFFKHSDWVHVTFFSNPAINGWMTLYSYDQEDDQYQLVTKDTPLLEEDVIAFAACFNHERFTKIGLGWLEHFPTEEETNAVDVLKDDDW